MNEHIKQIVYSLPAAANTVAVYLTYLPYVAAAFSIVWIIVQAYFFFKDRKNK